MARKIGVPEGGTKHLIHLAYEKGAAYQWEREVLVNALQAHATWIELGIVRELFEARGVAKRMCRDNGVGMNEDDLIEFMSSFGGGGKPISLSGNFGQGLKSACLEWNPYGLVVVSWTPETPEGRTIWIHKDLVSGDYELREFPVEHEDGSVYMDDVFVPCFDEELGFDLAALQSDEMKAAGHGTVVLFLGDAPERDTEFGDYMRGEDTIRGPIKYANGRFLEIPLIPSHPKGERVKLSIVELETKLDPSKTDRRFNKDTVWTKPSGELRTVHSRTVAGLRGFVPKGSTSGVVKVGRNTEIEWILMPKDAVLPGSGSYGPGKPNVLVEYSATFEGVPVVEAYLVGSPESAFSQAAAYRPFGLSEIRERVWLIVRPPVYVDGSPEWGIIADPARGGVYAKGGVELPMDEWARDFFGAFPDELQEAIREAREAASNGDPAAPTGRLRELMGRLSMRMRPTMLVSAVGGTVRGGVTTGRTGKVRPSVKRPPGPPGPPRPPRPPHKEPVGGAGDVAILDPNAAKHQQLGVERPKGSGLPAVVWLDKDRWAAADGENTPKLAARFTPPNPATDPDGRLTINRDFRVFAVEFRYWMDQYPHADPVAVQNLVESVYTEELVSKVLHAQQLKGQPVLNQGGDEFSESDGDKLVTPDALTASVIGLVNVEQRIRTAAGGTFGAARKDAAAI